MYLHSEIIHNKTSASRILPEVFKFIKPNSILDIGCGIGTWLSVAKDLGISDVLGVDGDYVNSDLLIKYIKKDEFHSHDLRQPLDLGRKFDLCLCLEVAEHLPQEAAEVLVQTLVCHADYILFSAAIPGQGGQNHLNEQWPEYWEKLFNRYDFVFFDILRPLIWNECDVDFWYKQNLFLIVTKQNDLFKADRNNVLSLIHPELFSAVFKENVLLKEKINKLKSERGLILSGRFDLSFYFKLLFKRIFN